MTRHDFSLLFNPLFAFLPFLSCIGKSADRPTIPEYYHGSSDLIGQISASSTSVGRLRYLEDRARTVLPPAKMFWNIYFYPSAFPYATSVPYRVA